MYWLIKDYWWVVLLVLVGIIVNAIKALNRIDQKRFLDNKPKLPPHRDFNDQWDDEDNWPRQDRKK
ncbi:YpfN family protein [Xenorhabdus nematophila]|uniref:Membrane protein n=1 Tax=Xenorhabdus nematophila (strain ATCC 19061 / DSM 3370 / CCUG 14189 / LMG 1036 / NCIMB 9965 / AN6) TaxID=406817 RepID=D3VI70_XENNA|nr:YpfN family protein [Xenorhabdus nematophila]AYA42440.1 YpfN family protein [Xenorhabdus nematophila]MBA0018633.1 YpfN family protein [Xenorhabdus nematophila]MCB4425763.1 hypothetical protein [Xenorhabdus nematophila]QNJ38310.1 YpfN family protein [Xenorhabdus nematophila]CBJ90710.1 putative membrane protein [Xenorhabdus nematophila ATCC 19061]